MKNLLLGILSAYESGGEGELASKKLALYITARYGSVSESRATLGDPVAVKEAYRQMQSEQCAV